MEWCTKQMGEMVNFDYIFELVLIWSRLASVVCLPMVMPMVFFFFGISPNIMVNPKVCN